MPMDPWHSGVLRPQVSCLLFRLATAYTFWYRPMIGTTGHLLGFIYYMSSNYCRAASFLPAFMFIAGRHLRWSSLCSCTAHLLPSDGVTTCGRYSPLASTAFFTSAQMHGLGPSRDVRILSLLVCAGLAMYVYSVSGLHNIHQVTWIPYIEFSTVLVMALLFGGGL